MMAKKTGKHSRGAHASNGSSKNTSYNQQPYNPTGYQQYNANQYGYGQPVAQNYGRQNYGSAAASKKDNNIFLRVVFLVAAIVLIICLSLLAVFGIQYCVQQRAYSDLETYAEIPSDVNSLSLSDLTVDWDALRAINPDIVGWIYVPDTMINYPIVQGKDNEEYLHKSFSGEEGFFANAGTIFLDANNSPDMLDRNNALYGHHMNDGSMFATIANWDNTDEFNKHRHIFVLTPNGNYLLTTFAYVKTVGSDAIVQTRFATQDDYRAYIKDKLNRSSVRQEGIVLDTNQINQSFLLSTCEYTNNDGRAIVFAAVTETTIPNDPYVTASKNAGTGLTGSEPLQLDN